LGREEGRKSSENRIRYRKKRKAGGSSFLKGKGEGRPKGMNNNLEHKDEEEVIILISGRKGPDRNEDEGRKRN